MQVKTDFFYPFVVAPVLGAHRHSAVVFTIAGKVLQGKSGGAVRSIAKNILRPDIHFLLAKVVAGPAQRRVRIAEYVGREDGVGPVGTDRKLETGRPVVVGGILQQVGGPERKLALRQDAGSNVI